MPVGSDSWIQLRSWNINIKNTNLSTSASKVSLETEGMIIVGIMFATVTLGNRPYAKDIIKVSLITAFILLPIVYVINLILGEPANFWYLMAKPDGASLMDVFPDPPYHLLYTTPLAIAVFYLIYLPYFIKDNFAK